MLQRTQNAVAPRPSHGQRVEPRTHARVRHPRRAGISARVPGAALEHALRKTDSACVALGTRTNPEQRFPGQNNHDRNRGPHQTADQQEFHPIDDCVGEQVGDVDHQVEDRGHQNIEADT